MPETHANRPSLPKLRDFERQFEEKFGREMTAEELKFYRLTEELLEHPPTQEIAPREDNEKAS